MKDRKAGRGAFLRTIFSGIVNLGKRLATVKKKLSDWPKTKERNNMLKGILFVLFLCGAIVAAVNCLLRSGSTDHHGDTDAPKPEETAKSIAPKAPSFRELFAQSCRLEQNIAGVVGGETGLASLLAAIETCEIERDEDNIYKIAYRSKQKKLAEYMEEYRKLEAKAAQLPVDERARVLFSAENYKVYQTLLNQKV